MPLACLGQDENLRQVLSMLFWLGMGRDFSGLEARRKCVSVVPTTCSTKS